MTVRIRRGHVLEDAFRQLASCTPAYLRGVIRIKFTNAHGVDEAGIDANGLYKEFLEDALRQAFDPSLGLFQVSEATQQLHPSPVPLATADQRALMEFVGRMLGKAVFDGILVDVHLADFFLNQILGRSNCIDDLPSFDPQLYRNLMMVRNYTGNVLELGLTFSVDTDVLGRRESHELLMGGGAVCVTNENRILYVHLVADFYLNRQLREQTRAFVTGFQAMVDGAWLRCFTAPELQWLISGATAQLDLDDLRRHARYEGGYHAHHRVIRWLFEVLAEFDEQDRALFLRFVTSCSRAPVLGFAHLQPPFTIRCVADHEAGDSEGGGIARALRALVGLGHADTQRLPTASTCFNLLKLPLFSKKASLRAKLRYAIRSHAGFEMS